MELDLDYGTYEHIELGLLLGKVIESYEISDENNVIKFIINGEEYYMYHQQDCCESVEIEEIIGDMDDLIGEPLTMSEKVTQKGKEDDWGTSTWTFYKFATIKGYVTLRWLGESNGYYSEAVWFVKMLNNPQ